MTSTSDTSEHPSSSDLLRRFRDESFEFRRARTRMPDAQSATGSVGAEPAPLPRAALQPDFVSSEKGYHVRDLLRFHHGRFIEAGYRAILLRVPDREGLRHAVEFLERGGSKIRFLGGLRYSDEGRAKRVLVTGLRWRYIVERLFRIPVLGYVLETTVAIARLPLAVRHHRALEFYVAGQIASVAASTGRATEIVRDEVAALNKFLAFALEEQVAHLLRLEASGYRLAELLQLQSGATDEVRVELAGLTQRLQSTDAHVKSELEALVDRLATNATQVEHIKSELEAMVDRFATNATQVKSELGALVDRFATNATQVKSELGALVDRSSVAEANVLSLNQQIADAALTQARLQAALDDQIGSVIPSLTAESLRLTTEIEWIKGADARESAKARQMDPFYIAFEDRFRGTREEIRARVAEYLPLVASVKVVSAEAPVLDLGCGRGEWLEVLRDQGSPGRGVDLNAISVADCRERGLHVDQVDALGFLQSLADESLGAITSMHLVEHLPFQTLLELLAECRRVLKTGGLLILETPNPANVLVGSNTFYLDPTHRNPIPSALLRFAVESVGFGNVSVMDLHPSDHQWSEVRSDMDSYLIQNLFGAQDYAVVGYKP